MQNLISKIAIRKQFSEKLPADPILENYSRQVPRACFSYVDAKVPRKPKMVHVSSSLLAELSMEGEDSKEFLDLMTGAKVFKDFSSYAMCYGGHQFGHWAGQLGDGRAINIAEMAINKRNWTLQLKGAGPTPYSRGSDGFAVLRSSIREYLCSEAMFHLGVPTTRALSIALTGDLVIRDMLYDGNPKKEQGAIVCRVAPSFLRFGNFEIFSARRELDLLKQLVDYTIDKHYKHLGNTGKETYLAFFKEVVSKTKDMIIHWQRVGFVHGVMNTDNMSILGLTIDYGPYGWLENYDPSWTPNTTDIQHKRYRFGNQSKIALWNLTQLANALYPLIKKVEPFQEILEDYRTSYALDYHQMIASKIGLYQTKKVSNEMIETLILNLEGSQLDMTIFFRELTDCATNDFNTFWKGIIHASYAVENELANQKEPWLTWFKEFSLLIEQENVDKKERKKNMQSVNPKYVLRNYMAQLAIDAAEKGNYSLVEELYTLLRSPYSDNPRMEKWYAKRPDWAMNKVGCSMLSCSS